MLRAAPHSAALPGGVASCGIGFDVQAEGKLRGPGRPPEAATATMSLARRGGGPAGAQEAGRNRRGEARATRKQ